MIVCGKERRRRNELVGVNKAAAARHLAAAAAADYSD